MIKVLFILPSFGLGGTTFSTLNMVKLLDKKVYDLYLMPIHDAGPAKNYFSEFKQIKAPLFFLRTVSNPSDGKLSNLLLRLLRGTDKIKIGKLTLGWYIDRIIASQFNRKYKFDFVCSCQEGSSTDIASTFADSKRIAWYRSEYSVYQDIVPLSRLKKEQAIYPLFDNIVCVSKTTRDDFCKFYPAISEKILAIHNVQKYQDIIEKSKECPKDLFDTKDFNIVSVGRIAKQKQFHKIPMIVDKLKTEGLKFKWYIIGDGNLLGENDRLQEEMLKYDTKGYLFLLGAKVNPYPYIKNANILVNTSYYEACPRVVAEAQILRTPVICSDFSSAREFVQDDFDGYVDTIDNLWKHIGRLISDNSYYKSIKANCDKKILDNSEIMLQLQKLFEL